MRHQRANSRSEGFQTYIIITIGIFKGTKGFICLIVLLAAGSLMPGGFFKRLFSSSGTAYELPTEESPRSSRCVRIVMTSIHVSERFIRRVLHEHEALSRDKGAGTSKLKEFPKRSISMPQSIGLKSPSPLLAVRNSAVSSTGSECLSLVNP